MSIQRIERLGVILALVLAFVAMPAAAQMKVGYVDTQYILTKYQRALDVQKQLENEGNAMATEHGQTGAFAAAESSAER